MFLERETAFVRPKAMASKTGLARGVWKAKPVTSARTNRKNITAGVICG